ncbi:bifunctional metallophosphatase/5'-nucleotidase [bacterium]|nr:bifunctional metallophosphatase/5'-nucleotidase [bacterium]
MMNKIIYVDMDDVLAETGRMLVQVVEEQFDRIVPFESITDFDLAQSFDLNETQLEQLFDEIHRSEILMNVDVLQGSIEALHNWHDSGYQIHILTGRPAYTRDTSIAWLQQKGIPFDSFEIVDKYGRQPDNAQALSLSDLQKRKYCFCIEDSPDMAIFLSEKMNAPVALIDRPWNREHAYNSLVVRITDWNDIYAFTT